VNPPATTSGRLTVLNPGLSLPGVRVEIMEKGKSVSVPVTASYGFHEATRDVELQLDDTGAVKPNSVALMLGADPSSEQKLFSPLTWWLQWVYKT